MYQTRIPNEKFCVVEFPGDVQNILRAIKMLGSTQYIGSSHQTGKLLLRFHPEDNRNIPIIGESRNITGLIIKVITKKNQQHTNSQSLKSILHQNENSQLINEMKRIAQNYFLQSKASNFQEFEMTQFSKINQFNNSTIQCIGRIDSIIQFNNMSDFQVIKPQKDCLNVLNSQQYLGILQQMSNYEHSISKAQEDYQLKNYYKTFNFSQQSKQEKQFYEIKHQSYDYLPHQFSFRQIPLPYYFQQKSKPKLLTSIIYSNLQSINNHKYFHNSSNFSSKFGRILKSVMTIDFNAPFVPSIQTLLDEKDRHHAKTQNNEGLLHSISKQKQQINMTCKDESDDNQLKQLIPIFASNDEIIKDFGLGLQFDTEFNQLIGSKDIIFSREENIDDSLSNSENLVSENENSKQNSKLITKRRNDRQGLVSQERMERLQRIARNLFDENYKNSRPIWTSLMLHKQILKEEKDEVFTNFNTKNNIVEQGQSICMDNQNNNLKLQSSIKLQFDSQSQTYTSSLPSQQQPNQDIQDMPPLNDSVLKKIIHNCAYNFSSGPWSRAWVRLGYDPRKDKTSRIFQILRIRLKYNQIQKVKKRAINYHTVSVQICDIPDSSFQAIARFSPFPSKCRSVDGWFFESSINDLRNRAHPIITQLYKNINTNIPYPSDIDVYLKACEMWLQKKAPLLIPHSSLNKNSKMINQQTGQNNDKSLNESLNTTEQEKKINLDDSLYAFNLSVPSFVSAQSLSLFSDQIIDNDISMNDQLFQSLEADEETGVENFVNQKNNRRQLMNYQINTKQPFIIPTIDEVAKTSDKILDNGTISKRSAFQIAHASNKALPLEFKKHIPQHLQVLRNDSQGRQAEQQQVNIQQVVNLQLAQLTQAKRMLTMPKFDPHPYFVMNMNENNQLEIDNLDLINDNVINRNFGTDVMQEAGTDSESAIIREQEDEQNI